MGPLAAYQSLLIHISETKSIWKVKFDKGLLLNFHAVKENHVQNVICPAVVVILTLKNQLFDNTGKV